MADPEPRLEPLRLRVLIGRDLDDRGITDPAVGEALGLPAMESDKLMRRQQWREGDVAALLAATAGLGVPTQRTEPRGET